MRNEALNVYDTFKKVFGENEARVLVQYFENADNKAIETAVNAKIERFSTKEQLAEVKQELLVQLANTKAEIIKWMFIFWIGNVATMIAIIKLLQ